MSSFFITSKKHGKFEVFVDQEDLGRVSKFKWHMHKGSKDTTWYVYGNPKQNEGYRKLHRFLMGVVDPKIIVDHIDRNGLNNRRSTNLRLVNAQQNSENMKVHKDNGTKTKGVSFSKTMNKFWARIMRNGKAYRLGFFDTVEEAAQAYNKKAKELENDKC